MLFEAYPLVLDLFITKYSDRIVDVVSDGCYDWPGQNCLQKDHELYASLGEPSKKAYILSGQVEGGKTIVL